ncbi:MAG: trypsin-like peptidase domain-containing protein [Patescibacteria group bacterium]|nr:trypsin-like peptidase domain-containing protein [Patescibacteria group bacterium]
MDEKIEEKAKQAKPTIQTKAKKNDYKVLFILVYFLIGILGGVFGSFVYLDYKSQNGENVLSRTIRQNVTESSAVIDAVKKVGPSVVSITGETKTVDFFGNAGSSKSSGTGFIIDKNGLIITNKHVVSNQNASYSVFTSEGKEYKAEIKAIDPSNDIAFLKINANNLPVAELGNSDSLQVGQSVVAIGNALGQYQNTVTAGVISAIGRAIEAGDSSSGSSESLENVIQTDAAINPGNSGGPLVNLAGQIIGINTAIDQNGQSIGFAIPINTAKTDVDSVISKGKIIRPMLGVRYIPITKEFAASNNLSVPEGAYIYGSRSELGVLPGSPAEKAGLKDGDIITKIGDNKISASQSLSSIIAKYKVGDKVKISYIRDGKQKTTEVTLTEAN